MGSYFSKTQTIDSIPIDPNLTAKKAFGADGNQVEFSS